MQNQLYLQQPSTQLQPWYRPASIRPPVLVRSQSSWSIAGAHYEHWATSLGNFSVTPFFGGNLKHTTADTTTRMRITQVSLPWGFCFFILKKQVLLWLVVGGGGFHRFWDDSIQEILPLLKTFTNEAERTFRLDLPRRRSLRSYKSTWALGPTKALC